MLIENPRVYNFKFPRVIMDIQINTQILCNIIEIREFRPITRSDQENDNYDFASLFHLTEFPSISTFITQYECGHRFICRTCLYLIICAITFLTFAAFKQVSLRSLHGGKLRIVDRLLLKLFAQLFDFVARHLLRCHHRKSSGRDCADNKVGP